MIATKERGTDRAPTTDLWTIAMPDAAPRTVSELFLRQAVNRLRHDYLKKITTCLDALGDDDLWWRPNEYSNSVGNLSLHLAGNLRQWVVHGVGGAIDVRTRDQEFATRQGITKKDLLRRLEKAVLEAEETICRMTESDLTAERTIQGYRTTGLAAVFHAVEHFSGHTGQILWITKMRLGRDLRFYDL